MAAAARRIPSAPAAAQPVLPDEILEEIFLRLDAAADLARASAASSPRAGSSAASGPSTPHPSSDCSKPGLIYPSLPSTNSSPSSRHTAPPRRPARSRVPPTSPFPSSPTPARGCPSTAAMGVSSSPGTGTSPMKSPPLWSATPCIAGMS
ncbi:unnamed protein product [Urochloa humidicola]